MASSKSVYALAVGDTHGNFEGIELATQFAKEHGVSQDMQFFVGDHLYDLGSQISRDAAKRNLEFRAQLNPESLLWKHLEEGIFSTEQLDRLSKPGKAIDEIIEELSEETYKQILEINPHAKTVAGNWDHEKAIKKIFKDQLLDDTVIETQGLTVSGHSGGGSPPAGFAGTDRGFFTDNFEKGISRAESSKKILHNPKFDEIDIEISHIAKPKEGLFTDEWSRQKQRIDLERKRLGLKIPKLALHGHHHSSNLRMEWLVSRDPITGEAMKQLTLHPGILALDHNDGSHGAFCITEFDTETKLLKSVKEFHMYKTLEGKTKVLHYANHQVDHDKEEIEFSLVNKIIHEQETKHFQSNKEQVDQGYLAITKTLDFEYKGLYGAELEAKLTRDISIIKAKGEEAKKIVKMALDTVKEQWLFKARQEGKHNGKFTFLEEQEQFNTVRSLLAQEAAKQWNLELDVLRSEIRDNSVLEEILVEKTFGLNVGKMQEDLAINEQKFENIPSQWGKKFLKSVEANIAGTYTNYLFSRLEKEQLMSIINDVYAPQNVSQQREISTQEAKELLIQGITKGYFTPEELTETGAYSIKKSFSQNIQSAAQITQRFGVEHRIEREIPTVKEQLAHAGIDYQHSLRDDLKSGNATLIRSGDHYLVELAANDRLYRPEIDPHKEGIEDLTDSAMPLWQYQEANAMRKRQEQEQIAQLYSQLAKENAAYKAKEHNETAKDQSTIQNAA